MSIRKQDTAVFHSGRSAMKFFFRLFVFGALAAALAWACGVRLNMRAVKMPALGGAKKFAEIRLKNGNVFAGRVLAESAEEVRVLVGEGEAGFSRQEIDGIRYIDAKEAAGLDGVDTAGQARLITYDPEKNLLRFLQQGGQGAKGGRVPYKKGAKAGAPSSSWFPDFNPGASYGAVMSRVKQAASGLSARGQPSDKEAAKTAGQDSGK